MKKSLDAAIEKAKQQCLSEQGQIHTGLIDVNSQLIALLYSDDWSNEQLSFLQGWLKKIDIASKHYSQYQLNWKLSQSKIAPSNKCYELTLLMALRLLEKTANHTTVAGHLLKCCNVIYKLLDRVVGEFEPNKATIEVHLETLLEKCQVTGVKPSVVSTSDNEGLTVLPITVLFWEGPIARAYLETIKAMGLKVKKIIRLVSSLDLVTKKPLGRLLPQSLRTAYAANKQFKQIFYWPQLYQSKHSKTIKQIQSQVNLDYGFAKSTLQSATQNTDLSQYTEELDSMLISGLKDKGLFEKIKQEPADLFLFTGGGIVPNELLSIENKKMIHIHPGYLPEIRGADCVLWSQLLAHRLSASAFFLAPGIDVGDVLFPCWLPDLNLNISEPADNQVKYRMIYGFLDPWVRSFVLKQTILFTHGMTEMKSKSQTESAGMTYHFMHEKMKQRSFDKFGW